MVGGMNTETRQFKTAAARRKGEPLKFEIEHWLTAPQPDDWDEATEGPWSPDSEVITETMRVNPLVDVVTVGAAFGGFGQMLQTFTKDGETPAEEKIRKLDVELPRARMALRGLLIPTDRAKWDRVSDGVDVSTLGEVVRYITTELSGLDPTQLNGSSDGSSTTSDGSTVGVQPAE